MSYWTFQIDGEWPEGYDSDIFFESEEDAVAAALQKIGDNETPTAEIKLFEVSHRKTGRAKVEVTWVDSPKKK